MSLDLLQVAPQIQEMAREVGAHRQAFARRLDVAMDLMRTWDDRLTELRALAHSGQPWLVAEPLEPLLATRAAPPLPDDVTVVATDGSQVDLDRHGLAQCYLVNVGAAVIRYGAEPHAALTTQPALYYRDDDLFLDDDGARVPMQGALIDLKRTLAELERALELARDLRGAGAPVVAVLDGTLLLWQFSGRAAEEVYVADAIGEYAAGLARFRRLDVPVCAYVSRPNGHELTNLLRLAGCPDDAGRCDRCHGGQCLRTLLEPLPDRALMGRLHPGERSGRFASHSPVLRHYGPGGGIQFVYLHAGDEVARLEVPAWVGDDPAMLDLVHAVVYDGCRRGWGYPPALAEAHEQAVIRGSDRTAFLGMVADALNRADLPAAISAKGLSKQRRAV